MTGRIHVWLVTTLLVLLGTNTDNGDQRPPPPAPQPSPRSPSSAATTYEYLGTKTCRMCHTKRHRTWLASAKANSWNALKPNVNPNVKRRAGLKVDQDYTTDERCLPCHTIGFGKPGGYFIPAPEDDAAKRFVAQRQGVGCEACHGPGSGFVEIMRDVTRKERNYSLREVQVAGRRILDRRVCLGCHNTDAICMVGTAGVEISNREWLNVDLTDTHGYHERFPLTRRKSEPPNSKDASHVNDGTSD